MLLKNKNMQQQLNLDIKNTTPIICEKCGNQTFIQSVMLREVPRILTGSLQDQIIPIPVFSCTKCNHVNEKFIPQELRDKEKEKQILHD